MSIEHSSYRLRNSSPIGPTANRMRRVWLLGAALALSAASCGDPLTSAEFRIHAHGGPKVLCWEAVVASDPGRGEVLIRQTAIGLNFIDVYERTGLYPGALPSGLGREGAGIVEAVGPRVRGFKPGAGSRMPRTSRAPMRRSGRSRPTGS